MDKRRYKSHQVHAQMETISPLLLQLFYGNLQRYAFTLQINTMQRRLLTLDPYVPSKYCAWRDWVMLDRGPVGDVVFLIKNYLSGFITPSEVEVYKDETELLGLLELLRNKKLTAVWYLHSTPEICRRNVAQRKAVDSEVKEDYLNEVDNLYFYCILWLMLMGGDKTVPIYVTDWRKFGEIETSYRSLYESISNDPLDPVTGVPAHRNRSFVSWSANPSPHSSTCRDAESGQVIAWIPYDNIKDLEKMPDESLPSTLR